MSIQPNESIIGHPKTVAEIRQVQRILAERERALIAEGAANYRNSQLGIAHRPLSDHDIRVAAHVKLMMNGSTPSHFLAPLANSRDEQIRAELDAITFVTRDLARKEELARFSEAEQWAADNDKPWRALCREIVLTAVKLASLEDRARQMLEPIQGTNVPLPMGGTIGSGLSLLGTGDPLLEWRTAALDLQIVTTNELRKAKNVE